ncbi:MAG: replicative DNA helicase [bacterium]
MAGALKQAVEKVQRAYELKSSVTGTPTGFLALDARTAGLQAGDLIILAARPAMGKTALALNLATNAAMHNRTVAVFSLEMPTVQLAARILASEARVDGERMRTGHLSDGDIDRLLQSVKRLNQLSVHIDDTPSLSVMECRSKCRRLASERTLPPLGLVVVDYLQLMKGRAGIKSREQEISDISRNLKALAKELSVPVIALSQLNRGVESRPNKRPQLSDLRESGAIEQDADIIMFVYRDEYYNEDSEDRGIAEVIIGKNRSGSTGTAKLKFFKQWTRFDNLEQDEGRG